MRSIRCRGTEEAPGLVLALDEEEGASCDGLALRPRAAEAGAVLAALRARELISDAWGERELPLRLADGREVRAITFVVRRGHRQHACGDAEEQARIISGARGPRGPSIDYLADTAAHLRTLGIVDPEIEALLAPARALGGLTAGRQRGGHGRRATLFAPSCNGGWSFMLRRPSLRR